MEITSFILGVCAVIVIMMVVGTSVNYITIKVLKKELETLKNQDRETIDYADSLNNHLQDEMDKIYGYVDSRHDKLQDNFQRDIDSIIKMVEEKNKSTEGNIREYLNNWQSSEEFAMILNSIKKKEFDSNLSKSY
jgi:CHASE3 domain sensor protein